MTDEELIPFLMDTVRQLTSTNVQLTKTLVMLSQNQRLLPQVLEDDGETYVTDEQDEDKLDIVTFGEVQFWDQEVTNELSEIVSSGSNLEE